MTVGVVGAGMSGLALVRAIAQHGEEVIAFEARDEPGGVVQSREVDGRVVELGPQRLRLTPGLESMIDDYDLGDSLRYGADDQPIYVYHDGDLKVAPLSVREAITTDLISPLGKLRMLLEPLFGPPKPGETVDEFLVRKFGTQAARRYAGPLYSGLYGTDPRNMLMEYSLGRVLEKRGIERSILLNVLASIRSDRETPPIVSFDDGVGELVDALYEAHADSIHLGTPVEAIRPVDGHDESGSAGGDGGTARYELETADGIERVDDVVVTTPAPVAADLLEPVDADLAATLDRFTYNPIGMVFLDSDFEGQGLGTLVPPDADDVSISGLTWNASILDRDRLYTAYLDPLSYPPLLEATEGELGQVAAREFERITGASAEPIHVHRWEPGMPAYDRSWTAMDDLEPPARIHLCASYVGRPGIPGRIRNAAALAEQLVGGTSE
ncbi:protoporphyrinogen oxidase [Halovivax asiaticus JCM 14624]|uniref:Protoporphyrinogen oxidase n=1 Tax=Halovivax asiaticus JCM 14624 TaxID=1227490 RepID=M0BJS3_9EURY|nr:protoporphyrinogen oxidase [Halovivax asiaticus]ELZ10732.1 protoporphyrinogen oxidase [Halovivax asiaticus JCM 14624]